MVPITVEREFIREIIDWKEEKKEIKEKGSFQLWVDNLEESTDLAVSFPRDAFFFDLLIGNFDRVSRNFGYIGTQNYLILFDSIDHVQKSQVGGTLALANDRGRFVLFDHALSCCNFSPDETLKVSDYKPSPDLLEKARALMKLTKEQLMLSIKELSEEEIEQLLKRCTYYIDKIDQEARSASQGAASSV